MMHKLVPIASQLAIFLEDIGAKNANVTITFSGPGADAVDAAIGHQTAVCYLPYEDGGDVLRTAEVGTVRLIWPSSENRD
jgi:hypothetical protein